MSPSAEIHTMKGVARISDPACDSGSELREGFVDDQTDVRNLHDLVGLTVLPPKKNIEVGTKVLFDCGIC